MRWSCLIFLLFCGLALSAQTVSPQQLADLQKQVTDARSNADNAWMLVSAALVLMMTGPGLALFYGGLVRKKNVLSTMMQSFAMMGIVTVIWGIVGFSLAFGPGNGFIGNLQHVFLHGVGAAPDPDYAATIPFQTFMVYQLMFAIITPALISGAFAERMKFSGMLVFLSLWSLVIYAPMAHMVWGKGGLLNASLGGRFPCLDFAGGTVVHVSSGVSALVCALYLGKRKDYPKEQIPPHSVVLSFVGACMLWVGWFGFNAGSALSAGSLATSAFVATHFAAAAAALSWMAAEWLRMDIPARWVVSLARSQVWWRLPRPQALSPPCRRWSSARLWECFCYFMVAKVKAWFGYDDSLDAFGVHGAGGTLGAILTGVFASRYVNPMFKDAQGNLMGSGLLDGNAHQLLNQAIGVLIAWVLAAVGTLLLLKLVDLTVGLRVTEDEEVRGLDLTQHGEEGYSLE